MLLDHGTSDSGTRSSRSGLLGPGGSPGSTSLRHVLLLPLLQQLLPILPLPQKEDTAEAKPTVMAAAAAMYSSCFGLRHALLQLLLLVPPAADGPRCAPAAQGSPSGHMPCPQLSQPDD
jgi:hypothetical protein